MNWNWSAYGERFRTPSGILELMDDLGDAMSGPRAAELCMLGGGNPAPIPAMQEHFRTRWREMGNDSRAVDRMLGQYDTSQGQPAFLRAMAGFLRRRYGWDIGPEHLAVTNGSQTAFYYLFNLLAGVGRDGRSRRILLPLSPEYVGYAEQGIAPELFRAVHGKRVPTGPHRFKYALDFDALRIDDSIAALAVSRPTNPTGNVLTDEELRRLSALAKAHGLPLLVDNAYGAPFPSILFRDITPIWEPHIVLAMSLSKLGLPGTRTGIIVADPELIRLFSSLHAVVGLASGNIGQSLLCPWLENDELPELCARHIRPFYLARSQRAEALWAEHLPDDLPYELHEPEGTMFHWLRFRELPVTSRELYQRLKQQDVLVIPGHFFFYGLETPAEEQEQCIRVHTAMSPDAVEKGIRIIGETVRALYG